MEGCPVHYRVFSSIPGLYLLEMPGANSQLPSVTKISLVAQMVKNLPSMQETGVQSLRWEDPLEKGKATHSSILPGEFHGLYRSWGCKLSDFLFHFPFYQEGCQTTESRTSQHARLSFLIIYLTRIYPDVSNLIWPKSRNLISLAPP